MTTRIIVWLVNTFWAVIAASVILVALVVSLGRYYLPLIDNFRADFERNAGAALSADVKTKKIVADWQGFNPILGVERLIVTGESSDSAVPIRILSANEAQVEIDLLRSLVALAPVYREALVVGLQLHFYKRANGRWRSPLLQGGSGVDIADIYGAAHGLRLVGTQLVFHDKDKVNIVSVANLSLERGQNLTQSMLRIVDDVNSKPLDLVVETRGRLGSNDFSLAAYLQAESVDLSPYRFLSGDLVRSDRVSLSLWAHWATGDQFRVHGKAVAATLFIGSSFKAQNVTADVGLRTSNHGWVYCSDNVVFETNGATLRLPSFRLDLSDDMASMKLSMLRFDVAKTDQILAFLPDRFGRIADALEALQPQGSLRKIALHLDYKGLQWVPSFIAQADDVSVNSWRGSPVFEGLTGVLQHHKNYGWFTSDSKDLVMSMAKLYADPFELKAVSGRYGWHLGERITVLSDGIRGDSVFGKFDGQFVLDLPRNRTDTGLAPSMTLALNLERTQATIAPAILPAVAAIADVKRWLVEADLEGNLPRTKLLLNTGIGESHRWFPALQVLIGSDQLNLSVGADWPRIKSYGTKAVLSHKNLRTVSPRATALGVDLANLGGEVNVLGNTAKIGFSGTGMGSLQSGLAIFQQTPLADVIGRGADGWSGAGDFSSEFSVGFRLDDWPKVETQVHTSIIDGTLLLAEADIEFTRVQAEVYYDKGELSSEQLSAELFGEQWQAILSTAAKGSAYYLDAQGGFTIASVADWLEQPLLLFANGKSAASAKLTISSDEAPTIKLHTDLLGVTIDLPEPFLKTKKQPLTVALDARLGKQLDLSLRSDIAQFEALVGAKVQASVGLGYNVSPPPMPELGVLVTGHIAQLAADDAIKLIDDYTKLSETYPVGSEFIPVRVDDFVVQRTLLSDEFVGETRISAWNDVDKWFVDFSSESASGAVQWAEDAPLKVDLRQLNYPFPPLPKTDINEGVSPWRPSDLMAMDISVDNFEWEGDDYGTWRFNIRPTTSGVKFDHIVGSFKQASLSGVSEQLPASLSWVDGRGKPDISQFQGQLSAKNVKQVFKAFDIEPMLSSKHGTATVNISWPSEPFNFDTQQLIGVVDFDLRDGQFLRTEGAPTGLLKLLGVFNFDNLVRRMRLDFGDLVHEGLSYDRFNASLSLSPGAVRISQPLSVEGPSSDFQMTGELDLNAQTIDGELVAVVPVSKNLPWLAALAGGLPAAAGVFLASKVFSDGFDRLSRASYSIKGPWTKPKIKFERLFDERKDAATVAPKEDQLQSSTDNGEQGAE